MHITPFLGALVLNIPRPLQFCSVGVNPSKEVERQEVKKSMRRYCKLTVQTDISWLLSQLSDTRPEVEANLRRE